MPIIVFERNFSIFDYCHSEIKVDLTSRNHKLARLDKSAALSCVVKGQVQAKEESIDGARRLRLPNSVMTHYDVQYTYLGMVHT